MPRTSCFPDNFQSRTQEIPTIASEFLCCSNGTYLLKNLVAGPFELGSPPSIQPRPDFSGLTLYRLASP